MKRTYIQSLQERRLTAYFTDKYGSDQAEHFYKLKEEFSELVHAVDTNQSDNCIIDEFSDVLCVLTHIINRDGYSIQQLLDLAMDKAVQRETNPDYKR